MAYPPLNPAPQNVKTGVDPLAARDWSMQKVNLPAPVAFGSPVITAVIDTGIDYNHEDLAGCYRDPLCYSSKINVAKYLGNPGHGAHCAGKVGALANNSWGVRGAGAGTQIIALKFYYGDGERNAGARDAAASIQSIDYAIKNGAKVISASWGGPQSRSDAEKSEIKKALIRATNAGVIVVVAAGNGDDQGVGFSLDTATKPLHLRADGIQ